jgi:hypothetical protein
MSGSAIFAVQDDTGTVSLLTIESHMAEPVAVGDVGSYSGIAFDHTTNGTPVDLPFVVGQVYNPNQFGVTTANSNLADWPAGGTITWATGANAGEHSTVIGMDGANAYIDTDFLEKYASSRGNFAYPESPIDPCQQAIVQATDYIDQKYRFKGIKLLQTMGDPGLNPDIGFVQPWLTPWVFGVRPFYTPSTSSQATEWPRQGVTDYSGDTINGIPKQVMQACAELTLRALNGVVLQPDYDPNVVMAGGIVASYSEEVGPIKTSKTFDTKLGIGFFPSFPQVDRLLARAGLLVAGGGRTIMR